MIWQTNHCFGQTENDFKFILLPTEKSVRKKPVGSAGRGVFVLSHVHVDSLRRKRFQIHLVTMREVGNKEVGRGGRYLYYLTFTLTLSAALSTQYNERPLGSGKLQKL